jgi:hypothetical protein
MRIPRRQMLVGAMSAGLGVIVGVGIASAAKPHVRVYRPPT